MLHNYLLTALRNLRRNRLFTAIHLSGLSIGLLGCILILLFVQEEFRYANYHSKGDRVYRVVRGPEKSAGRYYVNTYSGISPAMQQDFPEVETTARLLDDWWFQVQYEDKNFEIDIGLGDPALLDMFDIKLLKGDPKTVLSKPNTIILTERQAQSFFGDEDPIGKVLTIKDDSFPGEFVVTGIMQNMSRYATIAFDGLTSFPSTDSPQSFKNIFNSWGKTTRGRPYRNYIMLKEGISAAQVEAKFPDFETRYLNEEYASKIQYRLQPINRIRHYSEVDFGITDGHPWGVGESNPRQPRGIHRIHRLSWVGFILLIIACFNFMNLAIAQSNRRAREVGMRKVLGAKRTQLIRQFLTESVLLSCAALVIALGLTDLTLPLFNSFMQVNLTFTYELGLSLTLVGLAIIVGIVSGSYPAFFLSHLEPVITLKGHLNTLTGGAKLRKVLVVFQFAISSILVFAAVVMYFQSTFMSQKDLGFDPSRLVNMPIERYGSDTPYKVMTQAFANHHSVISATASSPYLGSWNNNGGTRRTAYAKDAPNRKIRTQVYGIDENYLQTYRIDLLKGRNLRNRESDKNSVLINETAAKQLGWDDPIGKQLELENVKTGTVVGVVKDYHTRSFHKPIGPVVLHHDNYFAITARLSKNDIPGAMDHLEKTWAQFLPGIPFEHWFVDKNLNMWYREDVQLRESCTLFSLVAIFIACLGLFGLASYASEQRTKEIGIRKTLGATVPNIFFIFSREFITLILIANLVAAPFAYALMRNWLDNFSYRIDLSFSHFLLCGIATLAFAIITVGYQAWRAGSANPVDALRTE